MMTAANKNKQAINRTETNTIKNYLFIAESKHERNNDSDSTDG